MNIGVTALHVYPIKSCRGVELDRAEVTSRGLRGDRQFQVIDADTRPVTQRQQPTLATVRPTPVEGGLRLEADGRPTIEIETPTVNDTTATSLLGESIEAGDAGDEAAAWFSDLLGSPARLVAVTDTSDRRVPFPGAEMNLGWADGCSVLIANETSWRWLAERSSEPFGMDRFRPNITVSADPWDEDTWRHVTIAGSEFGLGLAWPRCAIPQVDQIDGTRHKEPAKILKAHRWCTDASAAPPGLAGLLEGNGLFGIAFSVEEAAGEIAVGDEVTVVTAGARIIPAP